MPEEIIIPETETPEIDSVETQTPEPIVEEIPERKPGQVPLKHYRCNLGAKSMIKCNKIREILETCGGMNHKELFAAFEEELVVLGIRSAQYVYWYGRVMAGEGMINMFKKGYMEPLVLPVEDTGVVPETEEIVPGTEIVETVEVPETIAA